MKRCVTAVVAICLFSISAYAEDFKCDYKYIQAVKKVNGYSSEMSDETKKRWISKLEEVHQLCEEGKEEQAAEIIAELRKEADWELLFSTQDGN